MVGKTFNTERQFLFAVAAALAATAPMIGHAADVVPVHRTVSIAGIDVNTPQGASATYARLKNAARSLCKATSDPVYRAQSSVYRECIEDALAGAVRQVNNTLLSRHFVDDLGPQRAAQFGIGDRSRIAQK